MDKEQATQVVKQLWLTSNEVFRRLDASLGALHGIGMTEYMVLDALQDAPYKVMRRVDVAEAVARTASGVTRILAPMEKIGLIEKKTNERDARVSMVRVTKAGETIWREATATLQQKNAKLINGLDAEQLGAALALLEKLRIN